MKDRKPGLSIIIVLLVLSNIAGIFKLLLSAESLSKIYTFLSPDQMIWLSVIPVATILSLGGIWYGKRWGLGVAAFVYIVVLFLDVYYKVWPHALLATVGFVILGFFCWQSRKHFNIGENK